MRNEHKINGNNVMEDYEWEKLQWERKLKHLNASVLDIYVSPRKKSEGTVATQRDTNERET